MQPDEVISVSEEAGNVVLGEELTTNSLKAIFKAVLEGMNLSSPRSMASPCTSGQEIVVAKALNWNDIVPYPDQHHPRLDAWFVALETKLKGSRIPKQLWAEKFMECPKVSSEFKSFLQGVAEEREVNLDYDTIRKLALEEHGPLLPLEYYQRLFGKVRGETREDVMEQLKEIMLLYNRAAVDVNAAPYTYRRLVYYFIDAFPPEVSARLEQELGAALATKNPLQILQFKAPSRTAARPLTNAPLIAAMKVNDAFEETPEKKRRISHNGEDMNVAISTAAAQAADRAVSQTLAAISQQRRIGGGAILPNAKRPRGGSQKDGCCSGCGGTCFDRRSCPAYGRKCMFCNGMNHFARVCWQRAAKMAGHNEARGRQGDWNQQRTETPTFERERDFRPTKAEDSPP